MYVWLGKASHAEKGEWSSNSIKPQVVQSRQMEQRGGERVASEDISEQPTFKIRDDGYLYCEDLRVKDVQDTLCQTPFFLYSKLQIKRNYDAYSRALEGLDSIVGYAIKANNNLHLLKLLQEYGSGAVVVSANELRLALRAGFDPTRIVFNGNGKTQSDLTFAVQCGCLVNVDSEFDLEHIISAATTAGKTASVLIRINPNLDPQVHPYVSTGLASSKFGIRNDHLSWFLDRIREAGPSIRLVGVHSHLGSTIKSVTVFKDAAEIMVGFVKRIRGLGFETMRYLNIGGGLGIDYERLGASPSIPTPTDLVQSIRLHLEESNLTIIIEPGRSLVGNAGALVCSVIGVKSNGGKDFIVVDGSMTELIRPALYGAYHYITLIEPGTSAGKSFDVVGPVCESADFLGKDRKLPTPAELAGLAVMDAGAYCMAMASNYNMRPLPPEVIVDGKAWSIIRRGQTFEDLVALY